jgi:hypothetical protein
MSDLCDTPQPTQQSVLNQSGRDKFLLVLNLPKILKNRAVNDELINLDPLQISIYGTAVPPIQVPSNEVRFAGQSYNVSSYARLNYQPLSVKFIVDNRFRNYWVLWKWLTILNDPKESLYTGTKANLETFRDRIESGILTEYQTNFSVIGLNEYNEKGIEFSYYNGFITSLGGIEYNYREPSIIESTAEFQFSQLDVKLLN